jgi:hypothetical protein
MPTLFFPERDSLRRVLADGSAAATAAASPATAVFDGQDRLWLSTDAWLPKETLAHLTKQGVQIVGSSVAGNSEPVSCWHEVVPLEPVPLSPSSFAGPVLFDVPGEQFATFATELERLGTRSFSCQWLDTLNEETESPRMLIRTVAPPYFSVERALDAGSPIRAFVEQAPRLWAAAGWRHPLAQQIQPPSGKMLFLHPPRHWKWREEIAFDSNCAAGTEGSGGGGQVSGVKSRESVIRGQSRFPIPLRLVPDAGNESAELWVVRDDALGWLGRFVRAADERLLSRFVFAVTKDSGRPVVILRVRHVKESPPVLVGMPAGYRPLLKLANLYSPVGRRLTPVPRRATLRQILAPDANRLVWVRLLDDGSFRAESIPLAALRPLTEFVEHRIENETREVEPWTQGAGWEFESFRVKAETAPRAKPTPPEDKPVPQRQTMPSAPEQQEPTRRRGLLSRLFGRRRREEAPIAEPPAPIDDAAPIPVEDAVNSALRLPQERGVTPPAKADAARERAKALEARFLAALARLSPGDRLELWPELGAAYAQTGNSGDAAICWLNALWEQDKLSPSWAWAWLRAEAAQARWDPNHVRLTDWLNAAPTPARARAVAAYAVWVAQQKPLSSEFLANLGSLQTYLENHEAHLPLRAAWLARSAIARLTRGDVLDLARTRDRLLERLLDNGLGLDLDTPTFIRFAESGDPARFKLVQKWLAQRRTPIQKWIAQLGPERVGGEPERISLARFGFEAEVRGTGAYADLMVAWGLARLGEKVEAARLRDQAWQILDDADPIHGVLKSAFDFRIRQARDGKLADGPLPAELLARLDALNTDQRYNVDRLRQHSQILDPSERIDAYWASTYRGYRGWDQLRRKLVDLPGLEPTTLNERVRHLLARVDKESAATLPALLDKALDLAPRLERGLAEEVLNRVPEALDLIAGTSSLRLRLLEKGLLAAAYLQKETKVQRLANDFARYVEEQRGLPASSMLEGLTGQTFRCLRRLGLKNEADRVLFQVAGWLTRGEELPRLRKLRAAEWPSLMRTLLHVAAGWYYCGRDKEGHAIIDEVRKDLFEGAMPLGQRTALALTYASTLGQVPVRLALGRFEELFQRLKRIAINGSNTHYTLQPIQLVDAVVLAVVSKDFTLGPAVRSWMDDDEFLVRQRIHKELSELMNQQEV